MNAARLAWALVVALTLAACTNTAPPDVLDPAEGGTFNAPAPAQVGTRHRPEARDPRLRGDPPPPAPPTGGPHPPQRHALACKVDADCDDQPHCRDDACHCVRATCIAAKPAIDPVIDPAPLPPPET